MLAMDDFPIVPEPFALRLPLVERAGAGSHQGVHPVAVLVSGSQIDDLEDVNLPGRQGQIPAVVQALRPCDEPIDEPFRVFLVGFLARRKETRDVLLRP